MAKMKSLVASIVRGSTGGLTYTANKMHPIILRSRGIPTNPKTPSQTELQSAFSYASNTWRNLSDQQRAEWCQYASTCVYPNPIHNKYIPARNTFISSCSFYRYFHKKGFTLLQSNWDAPQFPGLLPLNIGAPKSPASGIGFRILVTNPGPETIHYFFQRSQPFDHSKESYKGPFLPHTFQGAPLGFPSSRNFEMNDLINDRVYFIRARFISYRSPFRLSGYTIFRVIAIP